MLASAISSPATAFSTGFDQLVPLGDIVRPDEELLLDRREVGEREVVADEWHRLVDLRGQVLERVCDRGARLLDVGRLLELREILLASSLTVKIAVEGDCRIRAASTASVRCHCSLTSSRVGIPGRPSTGRLAGSKATFDSSGFPPRRGPRV